MASSDIAPVTLGRARHQGRGFCNVDIGRHSCATRFSMMMRASTSIIVLFGTTPWTSVKYTAADARRPRFREVVVLHAFVLKWREGAKAVRLLPVLSGFMFGEGVKLQMCPPQRSLAYLSVFQLFAALQSTVIPLQIL